MKQLIRTLGLLLVVATFFGCGSIPFMGPGSMDLSVRGVELDEVVSIYLIVGDDADLADIDDPRTIEKVVRPERHGKYVTFGQFKPRKGQSWTLEQRLLKPSHPDIEVSLSKKEAKLEVEIDRKLLESHPQLAIAVVVNCGNLGWGAYQHITSFQIGSIDSMKLDVRGPTITLADSSTDSGITPPDAQK